MTYTTYLRQIYYTSFIASIVNMLYNYTIRLGHNKKNMESVNQQEDLCIEGNNHYLNGGRGFRLLVYTHFPLLQN
jgi:hypothetical protein